MREIDKGRDKKKLGSESTGDDLILSHLTCDTFFFLTRRMNWSVKN